MLCYCCAEKGIDQTAVALCRSCSAGLCLDHLRETTSRFASSNIPDRCHHDTWAVTERPLGAAERPHAESQP
jgi:hypothetical protein